MTVFSACLAHCGLTTADAAKILDQSLSTVRKKSAGNLPMLPEDAAALGKLYRLIQVGNVAGLPQGVLDAAAALRVLRGTEILPPRRQPVRPKKTKPAPEPEPPAD